MNEQTKDHWYPPDHTNEPSILKERIDELKHVAIGKLFVATTHDNISEYHGVDTCDAVEIVEELITKILKEMIIHG